MMEDLDFGLTPLAMHCPTPLGAMQWNGDEVGLLQMVLMIDV